MRADVSNPHLLKDEVRVLVRPHHITRLQLINVHQPRDGQVNSLPSAGPNNSGLGLPLRVNVGSASVLVLRGIGGKRQRQRERKRRRSWR